jgi:hypothetical protein
LLLLPAAAAVVAAAVEELQSSVRLNNRRNQTFQYKIILRWLTCFVNRRFDFIRNK